MARRVEGPGMADASLSKPRFGVGRSLLYSAILISLCFGLVEGGLRVYVYLFRAPAERFDLASGTFVLRPGEYPSWPDPVIVNSRGFVGPEFEDPPAPGTLRIVTVGDSCTFGAGSLRGTYPALLAEKLAANVNGRRYQVINAGIEGMNSELALRRLESRVVPLAPDLVTIYIGWNDLMKFDPDSLGENPRLAVVSRWLNRLWTVKGLRKLLFYTLRPRIAPPKTGPESRTGRYAEYKPVVYEQNLRAMIAAARGIPAEVVLITLPSVVSAEMSVEDLRRANVQFPYFRGANAVGDFVDLIAAYNRAIRRVAVEERVPLVDLAREMDARPDRRDLFLDTMHATSAGRELIADLLARELLATGVLDRLHAGG
jgi:lysophospholipase L1-like esterase